MSRRYLGTLGLGIIVPALSAAVLLVPLAPAIAGNSPAPATAEQAAADDSSSTEFGTSAAATASPQQIAALIQDLGSDKFAVRQRATRDLIGLGIATQNALEQAIESGDAEVRLRARKILTAVVAADFNQRLEAFAGDHGGGISQALPAWGKFSAQFGTSRPARQLFVEMQRAEPELLAAFEEGPEAATVAINERTRQIMDGQRESLGQLGTLATLLFVGAAEKVRVDEDGCLHIYPYVVQTTYHRNNKTSLWPGLLKKMVGQWIAKDTTPSMTNQNLTLAAQLDLKSETLAIATRVLATTDSPPGSKQISILMIGRFGDQDDLQLIEKLLEDQTSCGKVAVEQPPRQVDLQIRDIVLAAMLHMTGQNLHEYGYNSVQEFAPTVFQVGTLGFADEEARNLALKKWRQWRAEHPEA